MSGERLDLSSDVQPGDGESRRSSGPSGRRFLGIQFECCRVYAAIYPNRDCTAYVGNCPKCARSIKVPIGPGGSDTRFFRAN
jgi:hypothetical protein